MSQRRRWPLVRVCTVLGIVWVPRGSPIDRPIVAEVRMAHHGIMLLLVQMVVWVMWAGSKLVCGVLRFRRARDTRGVVGSKSWSTQTIVSTYRAKERIWNHFSFWSDVSDGANLLQFVWKDPQVLPEIVDCREFSIASQRNLDWTETNK